jgi:tRNA(fMet)-specific endonuclease VapC
VRKAREYREVFPRFTVSAITVLEVVKGLHKVGREDRLQVFLGSLKAVEFLTLDERSSELAGRIYADLERTGQSIGRADPMIAAIALQNGLTLVSGNVGHYERVADLGYKLRLDNWKKP